MRPGRTRAPWPALVLVLLLGCAGLRAAWGQSASTEVEPAIPEPTGYVTDVAEVLDDTTQAQLEAFLDQLDDKTGVQFAVLTMPSTAPILPTDYKVKVFERWGIGRKGKDEGLLMLVALEEREVRFETGYGLEGVLPDGVQSRIFREEMAPHFRSGDYAGGIVAGVLACSARIAADKGVTLEWDGRELRYTGETRKRLPTWVILLLVVIAISALSNLGRRRRRGTWDSGWGGWGGGFGGWGGGFGGGGFGGGFGGGGGGGSFGGFGGGASGGGGGGGRW